MQPHHVFDSTEAHGAQDKLSDEELISLCRRRTGIWHESPKHTCVYRKCHHVKVCQDATGKCQGRGHDHTGHLFMCTQSGCVHRCDANCPYGIMGQDMIPSCFISCRVISEQCTQMAKTEHGHGENAYATFSIVPPDLLSARASSSSYCKRVPMRPEQCYRLVSKVVFDLLMGDMKKNIAKHRSGAKHADLKRALKKYDKTCMSTQLVPNAIHKLHIIYSLKESKADRPTLPFQKQHHECYSSLCTFWALKCSQSEYGKTRSFPIIKNIVLAILYMSRTGLVIKSQTVIKKDHLLQSHLPSVADLRLQTTFRKGAALTEGRQYVINCINSASDISDFIL